MSRGSPHMRRFLRRVTSRSLAVGLMLALVSVLLLSLMVRGGAPSAPTDAGPNAVAFLAPGVLGLSQPSSSPLMLVLLSVLCLVMLVAAIQRVRVAWRRTTAPRRPRPGDGEQLEGAGEEISSRLAARGWLRLPAADPADVRLVRNPWGYWAGVVLHIGLVVIVVSALVVTLTERRAVASLRVGDTVGPGSVFVAQKHGFLSGPLTLPAGLTLDDVRPAFGPSGDLAQITTTLADASTSDLFTVAVNRVLSWRGMRVYQSQEFGPAYQLTFARARAVLGAQVVEMLVSSPAGSPTFRDVGMPWGPETLRVRSVVGAPGASEVTATVTLRLVQAGKVLGETLLTPGTQAELGPYTVRLDSVTWWDRLIFVQDTGIPFLFLGFLLTGSAAVVLYAAPVREVYIARFSDHTELVYRATGFAGSDEERQRIMRSAGLSEETQT